jgi:dipeptidase E
MQLYLSGGGSGENSARLDSLFVKALKKEKPLLYIPIAIDTKSHPYSDCLKWIHSNFDPLGFSNIVMCTDLRDKSFEDLNKFSGIYIGGGNTPKLLKELKESGFINFLKKACENNLPIYGGSAGAIIFAKTIIPSLSADENEVGLNDFNALNKIDGYDVWCHYEKSFDKMIKKYMEEYSLEKIIAIPENAGLRVTDEGTKIIGPGSVYLFDESGKAEIVEPEFV